MKRSYPHIAARRDAGATLIEAMIALLIFAMVILGFTNSTLSGRRTGDSSRQIAEATTLGLDKLEQLRTLSLADASLTPGAHNDPSSPLAADGTPGGVYTRTWTVTDGLPIAGMKRIEMRLRWPTQAGQTTLTLVSFLHLA